MFTELGVWHICRNVKKGITPKRKQEYEVFIKYKYFLRHLETYFIVRFLK